MARFFQSKPFWFTLLGLCLIAVVGLALWRFFPPNNSLELSGLVQAEEVKNGSRLGGRVARVLIQEGQPVEAGAPLVLLEDTQLRAQLKEAEASLQQTKAKKTLLSSGPDPEDIRQAQAQVAQAQQRLQLLANGSRPEEITQAAAAAEDARLQFEQAATRFETAQKTFEGGIISKQKVDQLAAGLRIGNQHP